MFGSFGAQPQRDNTRSRMDIPKLSRAGAQVGDGGYVLHEGVRVAELVEGILINCQERTFDEDGVVHNSRNRRLGKVAMMQSDANNRGDTEKLKASQSISLPETVDQRLNKLRQRLQGMNDKSFRDFQSQANGEVAKYQREVNRLKEDIKTIASLVERRKKRSEALKEVVKLIEDESFLAVGESYKRAWMDTIDLVRKHYPAD
ncbi:unnamed protein product [Alternaria sp. RS040]